MAVANAPDITCKFFALTELLSSCGKFSGFLDFLEDCKEQDNNYNTLDVAEREGTTRLNPSTASAMLGRLKNANKYFENAGMVQEYSKGAGIFSAFPVKEWEYTLASCKALGVYTDNGIERVSFPPAPGHKVIEVDSDILNKFLGLDQENGIELGLVQQHDLRARFNLTKMVQKHLAILAISGAGKSYTTAVLLEELLARNKEVGRVAVFMIDNHGEYINLEKEPLLEGQVKVYNAEELKINVAHMSAKSFAALLPQMSSVQVRELSRIISEIRQKFKSGESYGIDDISAAIDADEQIKQVTKDALHGWLQDLINMKIFAKADNPNPQVGGIPCLSASTKLSS